MIELVLLSLFTGGNSLIVGVPGLAKTLLINTVSQVLDLKFSRIQFTPDLMPSDITGTDIIQDDPETGGRRLVFTPGPIFANIVLADEINRTPPKTQAALLEAMQEHRVTVQGKTYTLEEPFHVFATQNPIELEGTYPLPEAQLDRFMFNIIMDYLPEDDEVRVATTTTAVQNHRFQHAVTGADIVAFQQLVRRVPIADPVARYAVRPRAHEPARPQRARLHQAVGVVRRQHARAAASHPRRQGARAHGRPLQRELRRHPRAGQAGAAPPRADELPRASRRTSRRIRSSTSCCARCRCRSRGCSRVRIHHGNRRRRDPAHQLSRSLGSRADRESRAAREGRRRRIHQRPATVRRTSGSSTDFAEHRAYMPGDDIRRIDWRLYARSDRYYVKEFEADTNTNFIVVLDVSPSMRYGGDTGAGESGASRS